jgi:thiol-disulfide isomerase/thioredoxin
MVGYILQFNLHAEKAMRIQGVATVIYAASVLCVSGCDRSSEHASESDGTVELHVSKIVVGAELPEFSLTSLENSESPYTREDLAGKIYLIDFWATWCLPCVAELPNLHEAYDKYRDFGFEILSVAMGDRRETIAELRETEWPMPWLHAFEPLDSDAAEVFELFGVPKAILVDSSNTIVGVDEDVRGEKLQEVLKRLLADAS